MLWKAYWDSQKDRDLLDIDNPVSESDKIFLEQSLQETPWKSNSLLNYL